MQKSSGLKWRLWFTLAVIIIVGLLRYMAQPADTLIQGNLTAATVQPSDSAYVAQKTVPNIGKVVCWSGVAILTITWMTFLLRRRNTEGQCDEGCSCNESTRFPEGGRGTRFVEHSVILILSSLSAMLLTGCGPARTDVFEEVGPNETVFVIPLQGDNKTSQAKFNSVEYLNERKISAKRIQINLVQKDTGRMYWDYEWIPASRVIKVNRALISREWTSADGTGTADKDESIPVVTRDGIQLNVGLAVTAFIEEEDAATYLYYHGEHKLAQVIDQNIRNYCVAELTREYGQQDLNAALTNAPLIFAKVFDNTRTYFKTKGISIQQLGNAEGFEFKRKEIQEAVNKRFIAEQDIETARQEKLAQDERNKKLVESAKAERESAEELFKAQEAAKLKNQMEIQMKQAEAALEMAKKWNGSLPASILPANSPLLLNLGAGQK